jgi:hypothetical protein
MDETKPKFKYVGVDWWSRPLYKSEKTGRVYVEVDGGLYTRTEDWEEPISQICLMTDIEIVMETK